MADIPWEDLAIEQGTTFKRTVTVYDQDDVTGTTPLDITGMSLAFRVFQIGQPPLFELPLAIPTPTNGQGQIEAKPDDYAALVPGVAYHHEFRLIDGVSNVSILLHGGFSLVTA